MGDSLFAESLVVNLSAARDVELAAIVASKKDVISSVQQLCPDAVIFAGPAPAAFDFIGELTRSRPGMIILHADPGSQTVQVVTSRSIAANVTDLLATIPFLSQGSEPDA